MGPLFLFLIGCMLSNFFIPSTSLSHSSLTTITWPSETTSDLRAISITQKPENHSTAPCSVFVGLETEFFWVFVGSPFRPGLIPTNSAGTQVSTVVITTGISVDAGRTKHQTTQTVLTFPTGFAAGAKSYETGTGVLSTGYTKFFFPTVLSLNQANRPTIPSSDPQGISFTLGSNLTKLHSNAFFASRYPDLRPLQTCQQILTLSESVAQPPTFVLPTTLIGPFDPGATASSLNITTTIFAKGTKPKTMEAPETRTFSSTNVPQFSGSRNMRSNSLTETVASAGPPPFRITRTSTRQSHSSPGITGAPSHSNSNASRVSAGGEATKTAQTQLSAWVKNGTVLVDGHTVRWNSTLTLGSEPAFTRLALTTNKLGQTVILADAITTDMHASDHGSRDVTSLAATPTAVIATSTTTIASKSTTVSNGSSIVQPGSLLALVCWSLQMIAVLVF